MRLLSRCLRHSGGQGFAFSHTEQSYQNGLRSSSALSMQADFGVLHATVDSSSQIFQALSSSFPLSAEIINAWSVNGETLNSPDLASRIFSVSIFPYLALLFFLSRKETNTPKIANFGFQFLLVFVFATIPAGILAKAWYHDILANVDYLHGLAESLLTVTNILLVTGFFLPKFLSGKKSQEPTNGDRLNLTFPQMPFPYILRSSRDVVLLLFALILGREFINTAFIGGEVNPSFLSAVPAIASYFSPHPEPANALSLPTWLVHTSSLFEWLLAMKYIWEYAEISENPRWKGLTWAMIPSHFSGLCAVTYHIFYNSPSFIWLVNLQALSTTVGNTAMAFAAYRIWDYGKNNKLLTSKAEALDTEHEVETEEFTDPKILFTNLLLKSLILAAIIKYGELIFKFPFDLQNNEMALMLIFIPTISILVKWGLRSRNYSLI